jgi:hypothetical protein
MDIHQPLFENYIKYTKFIQKSWFSVAVNTICIEESVFTIPSVHIQNGLTYDRLFVAF